MGTLMRWQALATLPIAASIAPHVEAQSVAQWRPFSTEASLRYGVPIDWIERVMHAESAGRISMDGRPITSRAGAMGLMQLMPATWAIMRARLGLGADPFDPHDNIMAGVAYLRLLYDRFGYPGLFAAYNAGPGRYAAYLAGRSALPAETSNYLVSVAGARMPPAAQASAAGIVAPANRPSVFALDIGSASRAAGGADALRPRSAGDLFAIGGGR